MVHRVVQAIFVGLQAFGAWDSFILRPQPPLGVTPSTMLKPLNPAEADEMQREGLRYIWWHEEGCAVSIASVSVRAAPAVLRLAPILPSAPSHLPYPVLISMCVPIRSLLCPIPCHHHTL